MPRHEESVETKLQRIAEKAGREPKFQFTSLFHLMNEELLLGCFERLRKDAAAGIDEVTKAAGELQLGEVPAVAGALPAPDSPYPGQYVLTS